MQKQVEVSGSLKSLVECMSNGNVQGALTALTAASDEEARYGGDHCMKLLALVLDPPTEQPKKRKKNKK